MSEAISFELLEKGGLQDSTMQRQQANPQDVIDFEKELGGANSDIKLVEAGNEGSQVSVEKVGQSDSISSSIVEKIDEATSQYRQNLDELQTELMNMKNAENNFNPASTLKLQFKVAELFIQSSVTTSIANKAHDGLKTLFRQQG